MATALAQTRPWILRSVLVVKSYTTGWSRLPPFTKCMEAREEMKEETMILRREALPILGREFSGEICSRLAGASGLMMAGKDGGERTHPITLRYSYSLIILEPLSQWKAELHSILLQKAFMWHWNAPAKRPAERMFVSWAGSM